MPLKTTWSGSQAPARSGCSLAPCIQANVRMSRPLCTASSILLPLFKRWHKATRLRGDEAVADGGSIIVCMMQGLGEELALCFASHGAKLILSARNIERLEVHYLPIDYCFILRLDCPPQHKAHRIDRSTQE